MSAANIVLRVARGEESIALSKDTGYHITVLEGLEAADVTLHLQADAQYDGSRETGERIEPRVIEVEAVYRGGIDKDTVRRRWLHFLNPHDELTLFIEYCGVSRWVTCRVSVPFKDLRAHLWEPLRFSFTLVCPKPALLGSGFRENMAGRIPMICDPFSIFEGAGFTADYRVFQQRLTIENTGDMDVGLTLTFTAKGNVKNPRLDNLTTGEYIRVLCDMEQGDVLLVSTVHGKKRVELNGVNISQKKDRQSKFWQLRRGVNVLSYNADENVSNLDDVRPSCDFAYLGV